VVVGAGENVLSNLKREEDGRFHPAVDHVDLPGGRWIATADEITSPPKPCFHHFPLQQYRAAGLVLPYRVFPNCSWGKCTFCADAKYAAHSPAAGGRPEMVAKELVNLAKEYGAEGIYFLDAELPEWFMLSCAEFMGRRPKTLRWGANARFTEGLGDHCRTTQLFKGGCRFLRFGLESASPRVLKAMRKGIQLDMAERALTAVHQAGIATHVYLMRGYPGETKEDWERTTKFLLHNASTIDMFNVSIFQLYDGAPVLRILNPENTLHRATHTKWEHPGLSPSNDLSEGLEKLEETFLSLKSSTRCRPTPADTILLADKMPIRYRNTCADTGTSKLGEERAS
jgi:hypothetical protein